VTPGPRPNVSSYVQDDGDRQRGPRNFNSGKRGAASATPVSRKVGGRGCLLIKPVVPLDGLGDAPPASLLAVGGIYSPTASFTL
jgi:hypothetical protein